MGLRAWRIAHGARFDVIAHVKKNEVLSSTTYFTVPCYIGRAWRMGRRARGSRKFARNDLGHSLAHVRELRESTFVELCIFQFQELSQVSVSRKMEDLKDTLITAVQAFPILWDPRDPDYKDNDQRNQVWEKIAKDYNFPKGKFLIYLICSMKTCIDLDVHRRTVVLPTQTTVNHICVVDISLLLFVSRFQETLLICLHHN